MLLENSTVTFLPVRPQEMAMKDVPSFVENMIIVGRLYPILQGLMDVVFVSIRLLKNCNSLVLEVKYHLIAVKKVFNNFVMVSTHITYGRTLESSDY